MIVQQGANKITAGVLVLDGTNQQLPAMPCKRVWVCASASDTYGAHTNSADAFAGAPDSVGTVRFGRRIALGGTTGIYIHVTHTNLVYFKGTSGDKLEYWIEA